ncbi:MAG TPA: hypothetical protein VGH87_27705, partial [Polyangiaceae bacterium]
MRVIAFIVFATCVACSGGERRFPMREPMWRDTDLDPVRAHVARYDSPLYWDGADNLFFRPLSESLGLVTSGESVNVNALDEVPDSAWFTNRISARAMTPEEVARGACTPEQILDAEHAADGSWLIDKGKTNGSTPGFRVTIPGKGKFMLKAEDKDDEPERQAASSVIGAAVFHAAGYYSACEQIVYVRSSLFTLEPGLVSKANFQDEKAFDRAALEKMLAQSTIHGRVRMSASAWIRGQSIGEYRFEGTRDDDPNDVIPHEDRRDLRGMRVLAAWIDRFDAREGNTFDTWMSSDAKRKDSPGIVLHYQLDTSEALGSTWAWDPISRRLGKSYVIDWGDIAADFVTLGALVRPWDTAKREPGREIFGYFDAEHFVADRWKSEYPNAAFSRMTERDAAWMARILARFTPETIHALAKSADFSDARDTRTLESTLEGRLARILDRYLARLSPIADVKIDGDSICGVDLAMLRSVRPASAFRFSARVVGGTLLAAANDGARVCVKVPHANDGAYIRIAIDDGFAKGPLVAHVYDLGARGFALAGL